MSVKCKRFLPRPYQDKAVREVLTLYTDGARKMLLHLPTGAGKTIIATLIIERLLPLIDSGKVLFIAHRRELLDQTAEKLKQHLPGLAVSIDQGERRADPAAQVVIASIQSLSKRKDAYRPEQFSLIVCDECHRALAPSWVEVIEHFNDERAGDALLLGMTATPRRTDGRSALDLFDLVAYEIAKPELQDLGYLVPIQYWGVKAALSLDQVKRSGGRFPGRCLVRGDGYAAGARADAKRLGGQGKGPQDTRLLRECPARASARCGFRLTGPRRRGARWPYQEPGGDSRAVQAGRC